MARWWLLGEGGTIPLGVGFLGPGSYHKYKVMCRMYGVCMLMIVYVNTRDVLSTPMTTRPLLPASEGRSPSSDEGHGPHHPVAPSDP